MTEDEYKEIVRRYHVLGQRAKGKAKTSSDWKEYDRAKREYHRAAKKMRDQNERD